MAFGKVTEENVYTCTGHPLKSDIANILDWMLNQDFSTAYRRILCPGGLFPAGINPALSQGSLSSVWGGCCSMGRPLGVAAEMRSGIWQGKAWKQGLDLLSSQKSWS